MVCVAHVFPAEGGAVGDGAFYACAIRAAGADGFHSGNPPGRNRGRRPHNNGPAKGLTRDDFTLLDKGKPQPMAPLPESFQKDAGYIALPAGAVSNRTDSRGHALRGATVTKTDRGLELPPTNFDDILQDYRVPKGMSCH
jgi:hypothetical protein